MESRVRILCVLLVAAVLSGCNGLFSSGGTSGTGERLYATTGPGAVIAQYGAFMYLIGGRGENGMVTNQVQMIPLLPDGTPDHASRQIQASLPEPREGAAAFVSGGLIYLVGGRDATGVPREEIFYTAVSASTGRLGFGSSAHWERNPRSLPHGLYDAAWVLQEGRVILAGGTTATGATDEIIHARIYNDGQIGYWHPATEKLGYPRTAAAAVVMGSMEEVSLVVAGGIHGTGGYLVNQLERFSIGDHGRLFPSSVELLPVAVARPILLVDRDDLIVGGGDVGDGDTGGWFRRVAAGAWQNAGSPPPPGTQGPSRVISDGTVSFVSVASAPDEFGTVQSAVLDIAPERPLLHPASGLVPTGATIRAISEPGVTLRYRTAGGGAVAGSVSLSDPVWEPGTSASGQMSISIRAFASDGRSSPTAQYMYRSRSTGFFLDTDRLSVLPEPPSTLPEVEPGWFFFDTSGGLMAISCTAGSTTRVSVFEPDYYTTIPDISGDAVLEREPGSSGPVLARFPAGRFFILVSSSDSDPVGIALYRM